MAALLLLFVSSSYAESPAAKLEGRVLDPTGGAVPGVIVRLHDQEGNLVRRSTTDFAGHFSFPQLPQGEYTVVALSEDFERVSVALKVSGNIVNHDLTFERARTVTTSIEVLGRAQELLQEIPGSAFLISRAELEERRPMDANEVLRGVPGVNLREDSGPVGMRLNVGLRGLNPDRSRQILVLEDGIPISLAPYGEPEMYYSPPIDRMRGVEVLKGSGQILYGPQTIGGVVNFLTPDPPPSTRGSLDLEGGQRGLFIGQASAGGSTRDQDAGWLINFLRKQGDGFRKFFFDINDLQSKLSVKPSEQHQLGLKLGVYDERSNSTYLGLTTPQFERDPNDNVVPSDLLKLERKSASISHTMVFNPAAVLSTNVFAYNTVRNWRRQNFDREDRGREYLAVEGDPSVPGGAVYLLDSNRHRNRAFTVAGWQTQFGLEHRSAGLRQKLDAGVRYVYEEADDQEIDGSRFDATSGSLRSDEDRFGRAFSTFVQNRMFLTSNVIFTPGVRLERYRYTRHIQRIPVGGVPTDVDRRADDLVTKLIPGLGLTVNVNSKLTFFTGLHRGFAPPRTKDAIAGDGVPLDLDAELSWNYEVGARFRPSRAVTGEVTFFRLDFENQIIPAAQSGGATTTLVNAGETLHQGLETSVRVDWGELTQSPLSLYTDIRYTYLPTARFTRDALFLGNRLPYAPKNIFAFLVGFRARQGFGVQLDSNYVGDQFGDNNMTVEPTADGTIGLLPGYSLWNLTADYTHQRERVSITPYFAVKNLGNNFYISSRAPQGIQPGLFRQMNAGVKFTF
jgi:Fe(3+) dicitrate transport protein